MPTREKQGFVTSMATQYGQRLRRFLALRLRNSPDVPDLAQEVFLRLLRVEDLGTIRSPEAYLFTIATHVVHQHRVRESTAPVKVDFMEVFAETPLVAGDDPQAAAVLDQRIEHLQRVLQELPPHLAATLVLARVHGKPLADIAQQLGVSRESVKKYLARAMEYCRQRQIDTDQDFV